MFEKIRIILFGEQPTIKVTDKMLERIIQRDFGTQIDLVKLKLEKVSGDTRNGKNRVSAAILKLANKDINLIDKYIETSINDFRDVISLAEYPRCDKFGFDVFKDQNKKRIFLDDWNEYSDWLNE